MGVIGFLPQICNKIEERDGWSGSGGPTMVVYSGSDDDSFESRC